MRALLVLLALATLADARPKRPVKKPVAVPVQQPNEMSPEDAAIALHFFEHFMDVLRGSMDCATVASRINFVVDRNRELVRLIAVATAEGRRMPKAVQDRMQQRMMKELMPVLQLCMSDPDVLAALERFQPRKRPEPSVN